MNIPDDLNSYLENMLTIKAPIYTEDLTWLHRRTMQRFVFVLHHRRKQKAANTLK